MHVPHTTVTVVPEVWLLHASNKSRSRSCILTLPGLLYVSAAALLAVSGKVVVAVAAERVGRLGSTA